MSDENTVWLSQFTNGNYLNIYSIDLSIPNIRDAKEFKYLQSKYEVDELSKSELDAFKLTLSQSNAFNDTWYAGNFIENESMPSELFYFPSLNELPKDNEVAFRIKNGYLLINQVFYDILKKYNLGKTHFSQVFIYDIETGNKVSDTPYYFINFAETREFVNWEESKGIKSNSHDKNNDLSFRYIHNPKDDEIVVTASADIDLWHEPRLKNSLFMSDSLVQDLFKAGITQKDLGLVSCRIQ